MLSKLGFVLLLLGCAGIESENMVIPAVMVLVGLALMAITGFAERRREYGISYRVCKWEMPQLRKQQKRLVGMAFYLEERSDNRYPKNI